MVLALGSGRLGIGGVDARRLRWLPGRSRSFLRRFRRCSGHGGALGLGRDLRRAFGLLRRKLERFRCVGPTHGHGPLHGVLSEVGCASHGSWVALPPQPIRCREPADRSFKRERACRAQEVRAAFPRNGEDLPGGRPILFRSQRSQLKEGRLATLRDGQHLSATTIVEIVLQFDEALPLVAIDGIEGRQRTSPDQHCGAREVLRSPRHLPRNGYQCLQQKFFGEGCLGQHDGTSENENAATTSSRSSISATRSVPQRHATTGTQSGRGLRSAYSTWPPPTGVENDTRWGTGIRNTACPRHHPPWGVRCTTRQVGAARIPIGMIFSCGGPCQRTSSSQHSC